MRVAFATFGCKINQYDTEQLRQEAMGQGSTIVPFDSEADVYVINTCSVTRKTDYQCRQKIRAAARKRAGATVVVTGCYAETRPDEIKKIPGVTFVVGNRDKSSLGSLLARCGPSELSGRHAQQQPVLRRTRTVLKIQDGCDNRCSYCIVPLARGASRSIPPDEVLRSFDAAAGAGAPEIVLSGIHIGMYGIDLSPAASLSSLLKNLVRRSGQVRIRLSSIEPNEITPDILSLLGNGLCRHLHIPLQSGDDRVLKAMERRYTAGDYRKRLETIAAKVPDAALGADVMVGFPGEDDAAFENTFKLVSEAPLTYLHVFSYSPRPGTSAAGMDRQVPELLKKERNERLRLLGFRKNLEFRRAMIGKIVQIAPESRDEGEDSCSGLTDNYVRVIVNKRVERNEGNKLIRVFVKEVTEQGTFGTHIYNSL